MLNKKCIFFLLSCFLLLWSCTGTDSVAPEPDVISGPCQYVAAYTATYAMSKGYPYEIIYGKIDGNYHVHTAAYIDGEWWWLRLRGRNTIVFTHDLWSEFIELDSYEMDEFLRYVEDIWG